MYDLKIQTISYDDCTLGRLSYKDLECFTLELPWLDNQQNVSCIPEGRYRAAKHVSPSLGDVLHLDDVDGRTYIYIHSGNFTSQILGCILVGDGIRYLNQDKIPDVTNSGDTFRELYSSLTDEFWIEIEREYHT